VPPPGFGTTPKDAIRRFLQCDLLATEESEEATKAIINGALAWAHKEGREDCWNYRIIQ